MNHRALTSAITLATVAVLSAVQPIPSAQGLWPDLAGRVGPYGGILTADDAKRMTSDGLTLTVLSTGAAPVLEALRNGGAKYIDLYPWGQINLKCKAQYEAQNASGQRLACKLSQEDHDAVLEATGTHLKQVAADPGLVAFWTLDDFPHGDISTTLKAVRALVMESNKSSGFNRPTICGIGGSLDARKTLRDTAVTPNRRYMEQSMINLSPEACDVVAPYFYGMATSDVPELIDWSMAALMPAFIQGLRDKGFNTAVPLLLPVSHAFTFHAANGTFYVSARPADIASQMKAYCEAGSLAMLFFTWQSRDATRSYSNDGTMREGVQQGRAECMAQWLQRAGTPTRRE